MKRTALFALLIIVFVFPLIVLVLYALAPGWRYPDLIPAEFDWRGLGYVFGPASEGGQGARILGHIGSSVLYSFLTVLAALAVTLVPAHHFARHDFKGKALWEGLLLAPALVPSMTFSMGVHFVFIRLGLADTLAGVVLVLTVFSYPYMLRALVAGYQAFGPEYELCARNLGAGRLRRMLRVELPLLLPSVVAGGSVVFLVAFSEYFLVFLIGGGAVKSFTGYLFPFLNSSDRSVASVLALVFLAVPALLFVLVDVLVIRVYRKKGMV